MSQIFRMLQNTWLKQWFIAKKQVSGSAMKLLIFIAICLGFVVGIPRDRLIFIVPGESRSAQRPTNYKPASRASPNRASAYRASAYRASAYGASVPKEFISEEDPREKEANKDITKANRS